MLNQRQATVQVILATLAARGVEYVLNGPDSVMSVLEDTDKTAIREQLFTMFREGEVSYKPEFQAKVNDDKELKKYISGLTNNWIRKAKEFNSGNQYVAKNPGSRAGSGDKELQNLKKLKTIVTQSGDADALIEVEEAITKRQGEIKPANTAKPIDVNALPEHLRHLAPETTEES